MWQRLYIARVIPVLLTSVPIRVTISVPEDLHRAIQSARGVLLQGFSTDFAYSSILETLARAGIAFYPSRPGSKGNIDFAAATEEQKHRLLQQVSDTWQRHIDASAYSDFQGQMDLPLSLLVEEMIDSLTRVPKPKPSGKRSGKGDAAVAQGQSTAVGTAEEGVGHPPAAPHK